MTWLLSIPIVALLVGGGFALTAWLDSRVPRGLIAPETQHALMRARGCPDA